MQPPPPAIPEDRPRRNNVQEPHPQPTPQDSTRALLRELIDLQKDANEIAARNRYHNRSTAQILTVAFVFWLISGMWILSTFLGA